MTSPTEDLNIPGRAPARHVAGGRRSERRPTNPDESDIHTDEQSDQVVTQRSSGLAGTVVNNQFVTIADINPTDAVRAFHEPKESKLQMKNKMPNKEGENVQVRKSRQINQPRRSNF
ncbi:hypothetical protein GJ496_000574 [Pomphorhynchus laevis]|nr:hypothetical protein GJ496_000574 [Pomphorhynchus laevis]